MLRNHFVVIYVFVLNTTMQNLLKSVLIIFLLSVVIQCEDKEDMQEEMIIEFGTECGWCGGQEYITVSSSKIIYLKNIPCGEEKGTVTKERKILSTEWNEIISSVDTRHFFSLEYNECNVCVDGCDEIIKITENKSTHELRYSPSEEIEGIENLQDLLSGILQEMSRSD